MSKYIEFVKINKDKLIHISEIANIEIFKGIPETLEIKLKNGEFEYVVGIYAIDLIYQLKPSLLEGNSRIKWKKNAWIVHNLIGHPLMQILSFFRLYKQAIWIHEKTIPKPVSYKIN